MLTSENHSKLSLCLWYLNSWLSGWLTCAPVCPPCHLHRGSVHAELLTLRRPLKFEGWAGWWLRKESLRPAWFTEQVPGQPGLHRETPLWALPLCISFTVFLAREQDSSCSGLDLWESTPFLGSVPGFRDTGLSHLPGFRSFCSWPQGDMECFSDPDNPKQAAGSRGGNWAGPCQSLVVVTFDRTRVKI